MGKGGKSGGKVCSSVYRVYNKRVYKGKKVAGKVRWRERVFSLLYIDIV